MCWTASTLSSPNTSLVSMRYNWLSSANGFPISSITSTNDWTWLPKLAWFARPCSWCVVAVGSFYWCFSEDSNSPTKRATSGPATIHHCSNFGFCVSPMAPPSPLTWALFCSCAWYIAITEKGFLVFWTVNLPLRNSCNTQGWRSPRLAMSHTCTGSHLA